jgi:hypothetical protein
MALWRKALIFPHCTEPCFKPGKLSFGDNVTLFQTLHRAL